MNLFDKTLWDLQNEKLIKIEPVNSWDYSDIAVVFKEELLEEIVKKYNKKFSEIIINCSLFEENKLINLTLTNFLDKYY